MPSTLPAPSDDACWAAVLARDPGAGGRFVYAVRTTGVYCRPGCTARTPRRENVSFHPTCEAAEAAGFRPCLRCRPDGPSPAVRREEVVARACRLIDGAETPPPLADLAAAAGHGLATAHIARPHEHGPAGGEAAPTVPVTHAARDLADLADRLGC